jgi:hypothetical protein
MDRSIGFAFSVPGEDAEVQASLLAGSIRAFGGRMANSPIWALVPGPTSELSEHTRKDLAALQVQVVSFGIEPEGRRFPFAPKVYGAAAAESIVRGQVDLLAWMDSDSIVVQEPAGLLLEAGHDLGYRPVDHTLIGSLGDEPIDGFWSLIYHLCGVKPDCLYGITTAVDGVRIRPYFNAGLLVVRPERGLLRSWRDTLRQLMAESVFDRFYEEAILYRCFLHQAALAGTILTLLDRSQMRQLPPEYAYPLHMHAMYPADSRPASLSDVATCRYDTFFNDTGWRNAAQIREPLRGWLEDRINTASGTESR